MKIFKLIIPSAVVPLLTFACASKPVIEYQDVYIPVKCTVTKPARPVYINDTVLMTFQLLEYVEILETSLKACISD